MDLIPLVRDLGFPIVCLIAVGLSLRSGAVWLGREIISPLKDAHVKFLDGLSRSVQQIADTQDQQSQLLAEISAQVRQCAAVRREA